MIVVYQIYFVEQQRSTEIKDCSTGKLYVGSAYGENGILGRWSAYAANGDGGNVELRDLDPSNFEFSPKRGG